MAVEVHDNLRIGDDLSGYLAQVSDDLLEDIHVRKGAGRTIGPGQRGGITVTVWGALGVVDHFTTIQHGIDHGNNIMSDVIVSEMPIGEPILYGADVIGEQDGRDIWLYFPALHLAWFNVDWEALLGEAFEACVSAEGQEEREARRENRNRDRFLEAAKQRGTSRLTELRAEIEEYEYNLQSYQRHVHTARTALNERQRILDAAMAMAAERMDDDTLLVEWEAVNRHVKIERTRWQTSCVLQLYTTELEIEHPVTGAKAPLGRFALTLDFQDNTLAVKNLTGRRGNYDHPHVRNGDVCLGEAADTARTLSRQREIGALVNIVIDLLEHANPEDDWGRHIEWWFGAEDAPEPTDTEEVAA